MGSNNLFIIFVATILQILPQADANINKLLCYDSKDGKCHVPLKLVLNIFILFYQVSSWKTLSMIESAETDEEDCPAG